MEYFYFVYGTVGCIIGNEPVPVAVEFDTVLKVFKPLDVPDNTFFLRSLMSEIRKEFLKEFLEKRPDLRDGKNFGVCQIKSMDRL